MRFSPVMKVSFQRTKKRGLLHTLLHRSFSICCDFKTFHFEIDHLKTILIKNNYPLNFIDSCIKSFFNKLYAPKVVVPNVPKKMFLLSYRSWKVLYFKFERSFKNYLVSHLTDKKVKIENNKLTAIHEHLLCCNYSPSFEDFSILTRESTDIKLKIMESLLIVRDKPIVNKVDSSLPLELF